jgi:DNA-binding NarL/FixJ family response regulator
MRLNTLIVEDHHLFAEGLSALLKVSGKWDVQVIDIVDEKEPMLDILESRKIQLLFLDLNLGKTNGLDLIGPIRETSPDTKIIVLTMYDDDKFVRQSFISGVDGYILKGSTLAELEEGIETVLQNNTFMGKGVQVTTRPHLAAFQKNNENAQHYMDGFMIRHHLTKREQEILKLITQAFSNKQIAKMLFISDQTVSVHRKNIMRKLGVSNTVSLVKMAQDLSLS